MVLCSLLLIVMTTSSARAQYMPYPGEAGLETVETEHTHDEFMLRFGLGMGFGVASVDSELRLASADGAGSTRETVTTELSGLTFLFHLDVGWAVLPNFVVHGRFSELQMPSAAVSSDEPVTSTDVRMPSLRRAPTISIAMLGPALTYYMMPFHGWVTLAIGAAVEREGEFEGDDELSDVGFALNLELGKGFWVGEQWTFEVGVRLWWSRTTSDDRQDAENVLQALGFGPTLAFTYQ